MKNLALLTLALIATPSYAGVARVMPIIVHVSPIVIAHPPAVSSGPAAPLDASAPQNLTIDLASGTLNCQYSGVHGVTDNGHQPDGSYITPANFKLDSLNPDGNSVVLDLSNSQFMNVQTTQEKLEAKVSATCSGALRTTVHLPFYGRLSRFEYTWENVFIGPFYEDLDQYLTKSLDTQYKDAGVRLHVKGQNIIGSQSDVFEGERKIPVAADLQNAASNDKYPLSLSNQIEGHDEGTSMCGTDIDLSLENLELTVQKDFRDAQNQATVIAAVPTIRFIFSPVDQHDEHCANK